MNILQRRADIDGLRAVAVLPVVLFHAGLGFPGGYVGVDVFFVISGYLISALILKQGTAFSFAEFWERRVRRIMPALAVMIVVTAVAAWALLFPDDLRRFGRSLVAQSLLLSNTFFWRDSGYFDEGAVRPLLHTWSLAVEEQFYLLFPFVLVGLRRLPRRWTSWLLAMLTALSFAVSVYGVYRRPIATFYLLPTRAWELLLGALLATLPPDCVPRKWLSEALSGAGVAAILLASLAYGSEMRFPGPAALLPCLGAAAVIAGNMAGPTFSGRVLSWRPLVFVGLISYSLYLWHWPLFTFARYLYAPLGHWAYGGLVIASLLLATASWKLVETPMRSRQVLSGRPRLFGAAVLATAGLLGFGTWLGAGDGAPQRWRPEALRYLEGKSDSGLRVEIGLASVRAGQLLELGGSTREQPIQLLVWGDSHAMATLHEVNLLCYTHRMRCVAATHSASAPLIGLPAEGQYSLREDADEYRRLLVQLVAREHVPAVLLSAVWSAYYEADPQLFRGAVTKTVQELSDAGAQVYILEDVPFPDFDVPTALAIATSRGRDVRKLGVLRAEHEARSHDANAIFAALREPALRVLDPSPLFLDGAGRYRVAQAGRALYFDHHHLSAFGSLQLRPLLEPIFNASRGRVLSGLRSDRVTETVQ